MKILTLHQPWASLLMSGAKLFETRSWKTSYRGSILLHASKKDPRWFLQSHPGFTKTANQALVDAGVLDYKCKWLSLSISLLRGLPRGVVLGEVYLTKVGPASQLKTCFSPSDNEMMFGDFSEGCWAWQFSYRISWNDGGVPFRGRQGLTTVKDQQLEEIARYHRTKESLT